MSIAARLDEAMKEAREYGPKGISQTALYELSGVPQATISRTLKGATDPEVPTIRNLAEALNLRFEWLNEGILPKYRHEVKPQEQPPPNNIKLAASQEKIAVSPETYAELIELFGHASDTKREEVLRILRGGGASRKRSARRGV